MMAYVFDFSGGRWHLILFVRGLELCLGVLLRFARLLGTLPVGVCLYSLIEHFFDVVQHAHVVLHELAEFEVVAVGLVQIDLVDFFVGVGQILERSRNGQLFFRVGQDRCALGEVLSRD